jgi:antimicrobial peptide system SdpB family protein
VIALAQLTILALTTWSNLMPEIAGQEQAPVCQGLSNASLFCLDPHPDHLAARVTAIVVLLSVMAGVAPRVVSFLHFWVSFSLASSIGLPDGGEQVAQVASLLVVFISLRDQRAFAWTRAQESTSGAGVLVGMAFAGWLVLRLQMAFIYAQSGLSKLTNEDWLNGSAMYYVIRDPSFGASGLVGSIFQAVTYNPVGTALLTWGTIIGEVLLAVLLLMGPAHRRVALLLAALLHIGIVLAIGLWSFAAIMIGAVVIAAAPQRARE